jgi:23S rRNA (uracil1939-C5)-methyltransferase
MSTSPSFEVELTTHLYGGESLGRLPDGRAVFVPFALPGERVRLRLVEEKRRYARAELVEVLEPAPQRITPRCRHYGFCGGCHYQHMAYQDQLKAKGEILQDQLERIGGLQDPPVEATIPCPHPWNYRNHVQFHLTPQGKLGYHKASSEQVFEVQECHLPQEAINVVWPQLDFEFLPEIDRIGLRQGAGEEVQIILESRELGAPELSVEDMAVSVVHLSPAGPIVLAGSQSLYLQVLERLFQVSAGSFFQVNLPMAEIMVEHLLAHLPLGKVDSLLEVYAGAGLFSAFLAPHVSQLAAIESSPQACEDFAFNLDEFDHVSLYEALAEMALTEVEIDPDVIVVDPPRAGLERQALDEIVALQPRMLAYVSCDPATLARDAKRLAKQGYRPTRITPFDLFPQTYHIESISFWERA